MRRLTRSWMRWRLIAVRGGLPGVSLAWGLWEQAGGMGAGLSEADLARMARSGLVALSAEEGLELFDRASRSMRLWCCRCVWICVRCARGARRGLGARGSAWPAWCGDALGESRLRDSLAESLVSLAAGEREGAVLEVVRAEVARALGHASPAAVASDRPLQEMGFDSLMAVELRNRLGARSWAEFAHDACVRLSHPGSARGVSGG